MVKLFWYRGMDGYSEADEYGNSKIWRQMRSGQKKERCSSNVKSRFRLKGVGVSELLTLESFLLRPMNSNSVLEEFNVRGFT